LVIWSMQEIAPRGWGRDRLKGGINKITKHQWNGGQDFCHLVSKREDHFSARKRGGRRREQKKHDERGDWGGVSHVYAAKPIH